MGIQDILLGVISGLAQGVTEWLPISSKTTLLLIFYAFGNPPSNAYVISLFLNGAASFAATIYFRKELVTIFRGIYVGGYGRSLLCFLLVSTFITAVAAIPLATAVAHLLTGFEEISMIIIGSLLILTSVFSWIRTRISEMEFREAPTFMDAVLSGVAQGFSALPGVSRSGITILTLLLLGHHPRSAIKLSFLMCIPATIGGSIYAYLLSPIVLMNVSVVTLVSSVITSVATSMAVIAFLLEASQKIKAHIFALILAMITLAVGIIQIM